MVIYEFTVSATSVANLECTSGLKQTTVTLCLGPHGLDVGCITPHGTTLRWCPQTKTSESVCVMDNSNFAFGASDTLIFTIHQYYPAEQLVWLPSPATRLCNRRNYIISWFGTLNFNDTAIHNHYIIVGLQLHKRLIDDVSRNFEPCKCLIQQWPGEYAVFAVRVPFLLRFAYCLFHSLYGPRDGNLNHIQQQLSLKKKCCWPRRLTL